MTPDELEESRLDEIMNQINLTFAVNSAMAGQWAQEIKRKHDA